MRVVESIYAWIRMPSASGSARHNARLVMFLCSFAVNAVNYSVFIAYELYLNPAVNCLFVVFCPAVLWSSYWCRDLPIKAFPHVIYDANASNMLLRLMVYAVLVVAMPILLGTGSAQSIAESLIMTVLGYTTAFLPILDDHVLVTSGFALYGLAAAMITFANQDQVEFSDGMRHMLLQNCFYSILSRGLLKIFDSQFEPPDQSAGDKARPFVAHLGNASRRSFEDLICQARDREGPHSVARLLGIYARRMRYEEELVAQLIFLYHCRNTRHLDAAVVFRIVELLGLGGHLHREVRPEFRLLPSIRSAGVSSCASDSESQGTRTTAELVRLRLRAVLVP